MGLTSSDGQKKGMTLLDYNDLVLVFILVSVGGLLSITLCNGISNGFIWFLVGLFFVSIVKCLNTKGGNSDE